MKNNNRDYMAKLTEIDNSLTELPHTMPTLAPIAESSNMNIFQCCIKWLKERLTL